MVQNLKYMLSGSLQEKKRKDEPWTKVWAKPYGKNQTNNIPNSRPSLWKNPEMPEMEL
jgi:uncharacterized phage-associated protein